VFFVRPSDKSVLVEPHAAGQCFSVCPDGHQIVSLGLVQGLRESRRAAIPCEDRGPKKTEQAARSGTIR